MTAIAEIAARVAQIQALSRPQATTATTSASGTRFADALSSAQSASATDSAATAGSGEVTGQSVVDQARTYLGIPYLWGGTDPKKGLDCSGLVQLVYKELGVSLPRVSQDQAHEGRSIPNLKQAKPGDLLTFGDPATHIGIYVGDNKMLHAPRTGDVVKIVDMKDYHRQPTDIRRVLSDQAAGAVTGASPVAGAPASGRLAGVPYANLFTAAAAKHGVSAALLAAVAKTESSFDPGAVSHAGARGLMQFMPGTARGLGIDPSDPAQAVDGAARLLKRLIGKFDSLPLALAGYNAGEGAVANYGGIPPYAETQAYVRKVQAAMKSYGG